MWGPKCWTGSKLYNDHSEFCDSILDPETKAYKTYSFIHRFTGSKGADAIISIALLALGDFADRDNYEGVPNSIDLWFAWAMFLLACFFIVLIFMNMLIAIMSEPFGDVQENKLKHLSQFKVGIILDFKDKIDVKHAFREFKYILIISPEESTVQDQLGDQLTLFDINRQLNDINTMNRKMQEE